MRVARDPHFADRLVGLAGTHPLIGSLTGRARFPVGFTSKVVTAMVRPGPVATADFDHYAGALSVALTALVSDPAACLDLLLDPVVLHGIAGSSRLDPDAVHEFILSGLHTSVLADPARLVDGYRVLARLTSITNGPLDDGIHPGMALGVAGSMVGYVDTLAPAVRQEGAYPVLVVSGTGSRSRSAPTTTSSTCSARSCATPEAQAALGIVLGGYVTAVVTRRRRRHRGTTRPGVREPIHGPDRRCDPDRARGGGDGRRQPTKLVGVRSAGRSGSAPHLASRSPGRTHRLGRWCRGRSPSARTSWRRSIRQRCTTRRFPHAPTT